MRYTVVSALLVLLGMCLTVSAFEEIIVDDLQGSDLIFFLDTGTGTDASIQSSGNCLTGLRDVYIAKTTTFVTGQLYSAGVSAGFWSVAFPGNGEGYAILQYNGANAIEPLSTPPGPVDIPPWAPLSTAGLPSDDLTRTGRITEFYFDYSSDHIGTLTFQFYDDNGGLGELVFDVEDNGQTLEREVFTLGCGANGDFTCTGGFTFDDAFAARFIIETLDDQGLDFTFAPGVFFGYQITGLIFVDCDQDGVFGAGDTFIENSNVELFDQTGTTLFGTTTSASDGTFSLFGVADGTFEVCTDDGDETATPFNPATGCQLVTLANQVDPAQLVFTYTVSGVSVTAPPGANIDCADATPINLSTTTLGVATGTACGDPAISHVDNRVDGICDNDFVINRVWEATFQGQSDFDTQVITVSDTTPPTVISFTNVDQDCASQANPFNTWVSTGANGQYNDDCSTVTLINPSSPPLSNPHCDSVVATFNIQDACGNPNSYTASYQVTDNTPPVIQNTGASDSAECSGSSQSSFFSWYDADAGETWADNCSTNNQVTITPDQPRSLANPSSGSCSNILAVTFTARDDCNNPSDATYSFTITDSTQPFFSPSPQDQSVECSISPNAAYTSWLNSNAFSSFTDTCRPGEVTISNNAAPATPNLPSQGSCTTPTTVIFTINDGCTAPVDGTATFFVSDTSAPTFDVFPQDLSVECTTQGANEAAFQAWLNSDANASASDACNDVTINNNGISGPAGCGVVTVTFTPVDTCDNVGQSATATFEITDNTPPSFDSIPTDVTQSCSTSSSAVQSAFTQFLNNIGGGIGVSTSDQCSLSNDLTVTNSYVIANGDDTLPNFTCTLTQTVTWFVSDNCGNQGTPVTATFRVEDNDPPVYNIPPQPQSAQCDGTQQTVFNNWLSTFGNSDANDVCGNVIEDVVTSPAILNQTLSAGSCQALTTITFSITDSCNPQANLVLGTATFTLSDNTPPQWTTGASDLTISCVASNVTAVLNAWVGTNGNTGIAVDACDPSPAITNTPAVLVPDQSGCQSSTFVTWTATDQCNDSATTSATFTVNVDAPPQFSQQASDLTVECDANGGTNQVDFQNWLNDNGGARAVSPCGDNISFTNDYNNESVEGCGGITITFFATNCGGTVSTTATFFINDTEPPSYAIAPQDESVSCDGAGNVASYNNWVTTRANSQAIDNCVINVSNSLTFSDNAPQTGPTTCDSVAVTWSVADPCGQNQVSDTSTFTVFDNSNPFYQTGTAPSDLTLSCDSTTNDSDIANWLAIPVGDDVCAGTSGVSLTNNYAQNPIPLPSLANGCPTSRAVTYTLSDQCTNTVVSTAIVTITDNDAPNLITPAQDLTFDCDGNGNVAEINAWLATNGGSVATDDCSDVAVANNFVTGTVLPCNGVQPVTFTYTDACNNQQVTTASIRSFDNTDPVFTFFPVDVTIPCDGSIDPSSTGIPLASDTCSGDVQVAHSDGPEVPGAANGRCPGDITIVRTWSATDDCGNTATQTQTITIQIARSAGPCDPVPCDPDACPGGGPVCCNDVEPVNCNAVPCISVPCEPVSCIGTYEGPTSVPNCNPVACTPVDCNPVNCVAVACLGSVSQQQPCEPVVVFMDDGEPDDDNNEPGNAYFQGVRCDDPLDNDDDDCFHIVVQGGGDDDDDSSVILSFSVILLLAVLFLVF